MTKDEDVLINGLIKGSTFALTLTRIASSFSTIIASILIGRYLGSNAVAALSFDKPVVSWLFSAFASVLSVGITIVCATTIGEGNRKKAGQYFTMANIVALLFSVAGILVFLLFLDPIVSFLGAKDVEVADMSKAYLVGWLIGLPAYIIQILLQSFIHLEGRNRRSVLAIAGMSVTTIFLEYVAVWMNLGMFGIALATSIGNYVSLIILGSYFLRKDAILQFHFEKGLPWKEMLVVTKYGISSMFAKLARFFRYYLMNQILMRFGGLMAVTAYMIRDSWIDMEGNVESGISSTVRMLSGVFYGEHNPNALKQTMKLSYKQTLRSYIPLAIITFFGAPLIVAMFLDTSDMETMVMAVYCLQIFAIAMPLYALCAVQLKYLEAIQKTALSNVMQALSEFIYPITCAWIFGKLFGINGVWISWPFSNILSILTYLIYIKLCHADILFLNDNPEMQEAKYGEYTVTSLEEACLASQYAEHFCKENGIDKHKTMALALCVEEVTSNCVTYGARDGKKHHVDVRFVLEENGDITLRIRDDCKFFDPLAYYGNKHFDDPASGIGIKMMFRMSKELKYAPLLGRNTVLITI